MMPARKMRMVIPHFQKVEFTRCLAVGRLPLLLIAG
jgi:hypothetical protein